MKSSALRLITLVGHQKVKATSQARHQSQQQYNDYDFQQEVTP
ncbi:MAG: hypothetical protein ACJAYC_001763 [Halieaceae bacterium]|jgi:hypothetical protein